MLISNEEFTEIVRAATSQDDSRAIFSIRRQSFTPRWATEFQELLNGLADLEFSRQPASPLQKLSEAGSEYGVRALKRTVSSDLLALMKPRAMRHIKHNLRQILSRVTRPCYALEFNAFRCAYGAVFSQNASPSRELLERKLLGDRPYDRLISLVKKFPVLAELWSRLICQWCDNVSELLGRVDADKHRVSRVFFGGQPVGKIIDLGAGLSDPHNKGRTVMRIQFEIGPIIYKARSGHGEQEWFRFVAYVNAASLRPRLIAARVLCRSGYCWMEEVKVRPCKDRPAARRFHKRLGGTIAAAYLLNAVDCHRDNIIASAEHPVLVDAEALWHVGGEKNTNFLDALYATGFLPTTGRRSSSQYRSSVLGRTPPGRHTPYLGATPLKVSNYEDVIVSGFRQAWRCLLGTKERRIAFVRYLQRRRSRGCRQIYRSTAEYDAILRASVQPAAMRSGAERNLFIAQSCSRNAAEQIITREEIKALKRLDVPYFVRRSSSRSRLPKDTVVPAELIEALRRGMHL
jgi:lantibiotic modifying enzyme